MKPGALELHYVGELADNSSLPATAGFAIRSADRTSARKIWIATVVAYVVLATGTAMTRQPYEDEGELASPSYNLVHRGHLELSTWEVARPSHKAYWNPPVYFFAQAGWQMLAGFGIIQLRLATVLWGLVLILAVGYIVKWFTADSVLAAAVAGALGLDYTFLMHASVGRPEMMCLSLAIGSTAVYLLLRERSLGMAVFVSHVVMTLSGLTHPVGGMLWMPVLIGVQFGLDRRKLRWQHYVLVAIPYVVGGSAWGAYVLQDLPEFRRQFVGVSLGARRFSGFGDPLGAIQREFGRFLGYYGVRPDASWGVRLKGVLPVGYLVGLCGALLIRDVRKQPFVKACLALLTFQMLVLTFVEGTKQYHYIVHVIPTLVAILVTLLWTLWEARPRRQWIVAAAAVALLFIQLGPVLFRIRQDPYHSDFLPTLAAMRPYVDRKFDVLTQAEFSIPLGFPYNTFSQFDYGYSRPRTPDIVVTSLNQFETNVALSRANPGLHRYMTVTFPARFELFYRHGDYAMYRRRLN